MVAPFRLLALDHVVLRVADLARARAFYCDVLGCAFEKWQDEFGLLQLRAGSSLIELISPHGKLRRLGRPPPAREARNVDPFCLRITPFNDAALLRLARPTMRRVVVGPRVRPPRLSQHRYRHCPLTGRRNPTPARDTSRAPPQKILSPARARGIPPPHPWAHRHRGAVR